eukprot:TRINITY_DN2139_c0_g1_i8.p1 TRINITY_DN2139_c0_g1~~TRINITY_DN2139_c0_g1_i8.p1  ORF type:complete len:445 (-),score=110.57 TRINITY_DN2139_c0_g1_i8:267-1601(-)
MTDTVHHDLDINRVEFIPDVEKPEDLPYYYYQAKRFAIQLIPLTEEEKADALKHKVVSNANPPPLLSSENKPDTDTDAVVVEPPHKKVENISTDGNKTDQASDKVGDANNVVEETKVESMVVVDDNVKTGESAETVITTATKESTETVDAASDAASDVASDIATEESKDSHDSCCMGKSQKKKKRGRARNHKKKLRAQRENDLIDSEKVIDRDGAPFEYRLEFSFVLWDGENYQDTDKLRKICRYYCRFLSKWGNYERKGGYEKRVHHDQIVDRDVFTAHYRRMKEKYKHWAEEWKEKTDPQKFVFEDVGIAAFLISLWEQEQKQRNLTSKQTFVDLGCGNGFLVYILACEGYNGRGIDIENRKIWDKYPENVKLEKSPIVPDEAEYEEDWLIGNHSDELTPWIPLMCSRKNIKYKSLVQRYFVLPCCEWDFDKKYTKKISKQI